MWLELVEDNSKVFLCHKLCCSLAITVTPPSVTPLHLQRSPLARTVYYESFLSLPFLPFLFLLFPSLLFCLTHTDITSHIYPPPTLHGGHMVGRYDMSSYFTFPTFGDVILALCKDITPFSWTPYTHRAQCANQRHF